MKLPCMMIFLLLQVLCSEAKEPAKAGSERWHAERIAKKLGGKTEVKVPNGRVDIVTATHAIEVEWARNWKNAIGQALWYAFQTNKKPAIYLIGEPKKVAKAALRLRSVIKANGLKVKVVER